MSLQTTIFSDSVRKRCPTLKTHFLLITESQIYPERGTFNYMIENQL